MKNITKILIAVAAAALLILAATILVKLIKGAFALAGGVLNTILGIVIIVALVAIVIWMLSYAKKKR